ncbi:LysR substrate-binding domain-containing protein [Massilia sp. CMS3.1]|uniref:LysR substrate-binding domain-containing protein n=1 Tax=Massilia sp. CMS3.1 TaxID=3373083 RepID=UPI003EE701FA
MKNLPLADLEAFVAVARHRSFRKGALERQVSPSLISQRINALEAQLGVRLLHRTTRSVMPTHEGEALLAALMPALQEIADAVERLDTQREQISGTLRISAPQPVVHYILAPLVGHFLRRYPHAELDIVAEDALIDIIGDRYDAGVRYGESLAPGVIAVPLVAECRMIAAASPAFVALNCMPGHPDDLASLSLIRHRFQSSRVLNWEFEKDGMKIVVVPSGPLTTNDPMLAVRAAIDGAGVVFEFDSYLQHAIDDGLLVPVLSDWCPSFPGPSLYYSSRRHMPAVLRAFIDFVRAESMIGQTSSHGVIARAALP